MSETRTPGKGRMGQGDDAACYLLFSGSQESPQGGLGDLVQAFACEEAARQAFHELRVRGQRHGLWAQLAVVDGAMGVKPLCWFGIRVTPRRGLVVGDGRRAATTRDWRRRWRARRDRLVTGRRGGASAHGAR